MSLRQSITPPELTFYLSVQPQRPLDIGSLPQKEKNHSRPCQGSHSLASPVGICRPLCVSLSHPRTPQELYPRPFVLYRELHSSCVISPTLSTPRTSLIAMVTPHSEHPVREEITCLVVFGPPSNHARTDDILYSSDNVTSRVHEAISFVVSPIF